mmetsp:Transcript_84867/g.205779  ORF Transcript_84867/g.205779 Transcript_84867/m.205779 type:complete len:216 (-) Transcript_84867:280-927(-)
MSHCVKFSANTFDSGGCVDTSLCRMPMLNVWAARSEKLNWFFATFISSILACISLSYLPSACASALLIFLRSSSASRFTRSASTCSFASSELTCIALPSMLKWNTTWSDGPGGSFLYSLALKSNTTMLAGTLGSFAVSTRVTSSSSSFSVSCSWSSGTTVVLVGTSNTSSTDPASAAPRPPRAPLPPPLAPFLPGFRLAGMAPRAASRPPRASNA